MKSPWYPNPEQRVNIETLHLQAERKLTSWITSRKEELSIIINKGVGVPDGLEEKRYKLGLEAFRAGTSHDEIRECNVGSVVIGVEVLAVPAAGKHELETKTVEAVGVKVVLVGHEVTVEGCLGSGVVVQAVEAKGLLLKGKLTDLVAAPFTLGGIGDWPSEVTETLVTGDHAETLRESSDVSGSVAGVSVEKVVCKHTASLRDQDGAAVGELEVEGWGPVSRHVLSNLA